MGTEPPGDDQVPNRIDHRFVKDDPACLPRFFFTNREGSPRWDGFHLADGDSQQGGCPKIGVDPQGEEGVIPGAVLEDVFDPVDVGFFPDRFDLDDGSFFWVIRVHFGLETSGKNLLT